MLSHKIHQSTPKGDPSSRTMGTILLIQEGLTPGESPRGQAELCLHLKLGSSISSRPITHHHLEPKPCSQPPGPAHGFIFPTIGLDKNPSRPPAKAPIVPQHETSHQNRPVPQNFRTGIPLDTSSVHRQWSHLFQDSDLNRIYSDSVLYSTLPKAPRASPRPYRDLKTKKACKKRIGFIRSFQQAPSPCHAPLLCGRLLIVRKTFNTFCFLKASFFISTPLFFKE